MNFIDDYTIEGEMSDEEFVTEARKKVEWDIEQDDKYAPTLSDETIWNQGEIVVYKDRFEYKGIPYKMTVHRHYDLDDMEVTRRHDNKVVCLYYPKSMRGLVDLISAMITDLENQAIDVLFTSHEFLSMCFGSDNPSRMYECPLRGQVDLLHITVREQVDYLPTLQKIYEKWIESKKELLGQIHKELN